MAPASLPLFLSRVPLHFLCATNESHLRKFGKAGTKQMKPRSTVRANVNIVESDVMTFSLVRSGVPLLLSHVRQWTRLNIPSLIRSLAIVVVPFLAIGTIHGTAVIVLRTPQDIIIATDSKVTTIDDRPQEPACKIHQAGRLYFSLAGVIDLPGTKL